MITTRRTLLRWTCRVADLAVMTLSLELANGLAWGRSQWHSLAEVLDLRLANLLPFIGLLIVWHLLFNSLGLDRLHRLSSWKSQIAEIVKATSLGTVVVIAFALVSDLHHLSPPFVAVFWTADTVGTVLVRHSILLALRYARFRGRNIRHMLIVGTNSRALAFAERIENTPELGYRISGFVDDQWGRIEESLIETKDKLVCRLDEVPQYLRSKVVDEVLLVLPLASCYQQAEQIARACEEQGVVLRYIPGLSLLNSDDSRFSRIGVELFHDEPVLTLQPPAMSGWQLVTKRCMDILVSSVLLVLLAPLLLVLALLVRLTTPGPALFLQERVGLNKRKFRILKLRTMRQAAEQEQAEIEHLNEMSGPVFKIEKDPRITPFGRFLRLTSLDELPQLINVVRGDMSLVGPRPLPVRDYEGFDHDWHRRRFSVRPGVTCLWQVNGRSSVPFERWMELDMQYIDHWSLWLDLKILAQTIPAVLRRRGAV